MSFRWLLAALALFSMPPLQAAPLTIAGSVVDESNAPLAGVAVNVNGTVVFSGADGGFSASTDGAGVYTLRFSSADHFPSVHSFSPLDLAWSRQDGVSTLPPVTLVARSEGRVMLTFGGDAMMGRRFSDPYPGDPVLIRPDHRAGDTRALLRHMKPYLELADFTSVNLETQVMAEQPEQNAPKSFVFYTPPEAVAALRDAGVDYVTLGNNHSNDYLEAGMRSTLAALEAAGMPFSGGGMNAADALAPYRATLGGQGWSFLGYVGWAGNFTPNQVADGPDKSGAAFGTPENLRNTVVPEAGAGFFPVVQYHGSREYTDEPTLVTETRLKGALDHGAVLAIAHHPHVVQGFELYDGRLIAYSMGNFIFDQYHYATRFSYIVHVWMDDGRFHRAEVVPIHLQGYTPMPATDTVRRTVLMRAAALSARRGVHFAVSGGHGVILRDGGPGTQPHPGAGALALAGPAGLVPLHDRAWNEPVNRIETTDGQRVRLGRNLLPMGHLENHFLHGSPDRSWIEDGSQAVVRTDAGEHVMRLEIPAGAGRGVVGMRTFEYTFEPGTPTTFALRARADAPATVTAYQQWRGGNDRNRFEALANNRLRPIGRLELSPGEWQDLRFDFDAPRVSAISYRVLLQVEPADGARDHVSEFDDFTLVQWATPPLSAGAVPAHLAVGQASHAELAPALR
jgi:poly-gamma-glutamate capsule biosynthesis protein CapA/YwtB (metallophosphatase superfamily)